MLRVKLQLIFVLIWFAFLFGIDRLVLNGGNLDLFVYGLAIAIGGVMLLVPKLRRQNVWLSAAVVLVLYLIGYALFAQARPETLSEIVTDTRFWVGGAAVLFTFALMRWISLSVDTIENLPPKMLANTRLYSPLEGEERIAEEVYRARRFERPMSVIYAALPPLKADTVKAPDNSTSPKQYARDQLILSISSLTYKSDIVVDYGEWLVIALPETDRRGSGIFVNNLGKMIRDLLKISPLVGISTHPEEGIVADELIKVAQANAKLYSEDEYSSFVGDRKGDLLFEVEDRLRIERQAEWVNKLPNNTVATRSTYLAIKRGVDILFVVALMPAVLPMMALVSLMIYLDDRQKIFYLQPRTGYGGKRFQMYKFRTMKVGAKSVPPKAVVTSDGSVRYMYPEKDDHDPRITRVGRILRKTSLDELPQLLNILRGDMSLIGPRPTSWTLDLYSPHQTTRLAIRPGITGLWQVSARDAPNFDERLLWDLKYIEKVSLWLDVKIALMTVLGMFQRSGK